MAEFTEFAVGKEYPLGDLRGKEGIFFAYDGNMASLICAFPRMTDYERTLVIREHGRVGLFMYAGVIFVSAKFGKLDGDYAYSVHLNDNPQDITITPTEPGKGMALNIFAVDSTNNKILGIRVCGTSSKWTNEFSRMIEEQKQQTFDMDDYLQKVTECQRRWTSKDLLRMSTTYKLGTGEGENPFEIFGR